jgi:hypothetical protein
VNQNDGPGTGPGEPGSKGAKGDHSCDNGNDTPKGNNGVGNGEDGQPPGDPKVNDGAGTGPGSPGSKGGHPAVTEAPADDADKGKPEAKGNEGVGNGEDPPPPGHDVNQNDGAGTGPGSPGSKGGSGTAADGDDPAKVKDVTAEHADNGVGNGQDAQPPGDPKVNDGDGTSPGSPGAQGVTAVIDHPMGGSANDTSHLGVTAGDCGPQNAADDSFVFGDSSNGISSGWTSMVEVHVDDHSGGAGTAWTIGVDKTVVVDNHTDQGKGQTHSNEQSHSDHGNAGNGHNDKLDW